LLTFFINGRCLIVKRQHSFEKQVKRGQIFLQRNLCNICSHKMSDFLKKSLLYLIWAFQLEINTNLEPQVILNAFSGIM
jgi:hypothetical protein